MRLNDDVVPGEKVLSSTIISIQVLTANNYIYEPLYSALQIANINSVCSMLYARSAQIGGLGCARLWVVWLVNSEGLGRLQPLTTYYAFANQPTHTHTRTSISCASFLKSSSVSNLFFWSGTTRGMVTCIVCNCFCTS